MNNILKKITQGLLFLYVTLSHAQTDPPPPGGGTGSVGTGQRASSVDMYVYVLAIVAILFIVHFAKKYRAQKSLN